jgi:hypothetical protein
VFPGRLVITPRFRHDLLNHLLGIPVRLEYDWRAVVVERLRPTGQAHILVEIRGQLGAVAVGRIASRRLAYELRAAGFTLVERTRWGWEAPRPVAKADLDGHVDEVPDCVCAG